MSNRRRRIPRAKGGLASYGVWRPNRLHRRNHSVGQWPSPVFDRQLNPTAEVARFQSGRAAPIDIDRAEESPPPQQVHAVGTQRRRRSTSREQLLQKRGDRFHDGALGVDHSVRLTQITGRGDLSTAGHNKAAYIPGLYWLLIHGRKAIGT